MVCASLTLLLCGSSLLSVYMTANDYAKGGADWPNSTCDPAINESVSPVNIFTKSAVVSSGFILDIFYHKATDQVYRLVYKGEPKVLKLRFPLNSFDIFVRFSDGRIVKYRAKEYIARVPSEHMVDGVRADAESQ